VHDIDASRVQQLASGRAPFYEQDLDPILRDGLRSGRLSFHTDPAGALVSSELIFLSVPTCANGDAEDLSAVIDATISVARHAREGAVLVNRTTAPVGTLGCIRALLSRARSGSIGVASNPEFLSEGTAIADFLSPYRVVIGAWEKSVVASVAEAYRPILDGRLPTGLRSTVRFGRNRKPVPLLVTTPETAELSKYAANAFLAVKISFINEIATIADEFGADVDDVARTVGLDPRVGTQFLRAGLGWGGSCFPKDIAVLKGMAETSGVSARLLSAANDVNNEQRQWVVRKLRAHLKTVAGRRVALLGLSYKPSTDDTRDAPGLEVAEQLLELDVRVRAYDPIVRHLPPGLEGSIDLATDPLAAATGADAVVIATEWDEIARLPLEDLRRVMHVPLVLDGRNCLDPERARMAGLIYVGVGRGTGHVLPIPHAGSFGEPVCQTSRPPTHGAVPTLSDARRRKASAASLTKG
jgi:UDPglucose 6-dehydrogenase